MKLSNIVENDTRRGFLQKSAGLMASLAGGNPFSVAKAGAKAAGRIGATATAVDPTVLVQKIMTKYLFPKLWNKTENEVIASLEKHSPGLLKIPLLKQTTDDDIIAGLDKLPMPDLLELVLGPNSRLMPGWLQQRGSDALNMIVSRIGPAEAIKSIMYHEEYTLPHAMRRLQSLRSHASSVASLMNKAGIADIKNMTPQKFDALEKISGVRFDDNVRQHYMKIMDRGKQVLKPEKQEPPQPSTSPTPHDQDDLSQWENEGGYVNRTFEEKLNRILTLIS